MRVACVLLAHFMVRLERRDRSELRALPVVVGGTPGERRAVLDCSPEALRQGVRPNMPLRQALALCREAIFVSPRSAVYAAAAEAIRTALARFSPEVQAVEQGRLLLNLDGTSALWPDEQRLALAMRDAVHEACRLNPSVGIADGLFAAHAAAVTAPVRRWIQIVPHGQAPSFLATLSVAHLPVSPEMQRRLQLFGLRRLGDLAALPAGAMQAQFGREGLYAWRLAAGVDEERLVVRAAAETLAERLELPAPTADLSALAHAAGVLLGRLFRRPEVGNRSVRRVTLCITLEDGRAWERTITFHDATADVQTALFSIRSRLDALELPNAAVEMTITLHELCGERGRQGSLFSGRSHRLAQLEEAIRHLRARLDAAAPILRLVEIEPWSRIPERRTALTEYIP